MIATGVIRLLTGTTYTINHGLTMEWVLRDIHTFVISERLFREHRWAPCSQLAY